jgi:S2P endopeptidase
VPLSHLPILLLGLAFCGIIHEAGHAVAASLYVFSMIYLPIGTNIIGVQRNIRDNLPLVSTGFHIHLVFPTFFVAISQSLATQPIPSRLRIATAGAWHNFVTWGLLALLGFSSFSITDLYPLPSSLSTKSSPHNLPDNEVCLPTSTCSPFGAHTRHLPPSRLWSYLGYENVLDRGIVITKVESDSPLYGHLLPGSVVTRVDDVRVGDMDDTGLESGNAFMRWYTYLGMDSVQWARKVQDDAGWCVPETWLNRKYSKHQIDMP